jgi:hypothetical protein
MSKGVLTSLGLALAGVAFASAARADEQPAQQDEPKRWNLHAAYEFDRVTSQPTDPGAPRSIQSLVVRAAVAFDADDEIALGALATYAFDAATGNTGLRGGDPFFSYSHRFRLPARFDLKTGVIVTAPASYAAQLASNITAPAAWVLLSRPIGDLSLWVSIFARYDWDKYPTSASLGDGTGSAGVGAGQPNLKDSVGGSVGAEYAMPFYRPVLLGAELIYTQSWLYDVGSLQPSGSSFGATGATTDPQLAQNPSFHNGGVDAHVRLAPRVGDLQPNATLGVCNTTAWLARTNGGVPLAYLAYTDRLDAYLAVGLTYTTN